ncbi:Xaa-Pro dipeptidyl-peptidase [Streptomyces sp. LP05-1]|uniref:Xaa-Pro dipeptidyl-peptidase n=1 Tax=Streptomyces pyxinae TaxID=2970734 RepID=A0ABT2CKS0_9ACTN|nr:Xaa-Pro dipeptidyl-peptidase [Streptomyces sp. LP05-1]MCS0638002.1 Xaa-Pro dipeptidyl-peptidase [Streptomyces sp. LP05-1]
MPLRVQGGRPPSRRPVPAVRGVRVVRVVLAAVAALFSVPAPALPATAAAPAGAVLPAAGEGTPDRPAGAGTAAVRESRPVYSYENALRESIWVETGADDDRDGRTDRVAVDLVRPREPAAAGRRIPVIMDASPYYSCCGRGNESQKKTYDANGRPVQFPLYYDNYFVPRGYAYAAVDLAGTNRSDGCEDVGGRSEVRSAKAVVDWLNGRARGWTARTGGAPTRATGWSTGATAMIGKSWDGTVANGVAATGVKGLRTIVPIGAISSWYDYYFAQGAPLYGSGPEGLADLVSSRDSAARCAHVRRRLVEGAPRTGDLTPFWDERDYVKDARKVRASVFAVHGQQDLNVRAKHIGQWWDALAKAGVERRIWLSGTGHVDPFDFRRTEWVGALHRWFDHYLLGHDNGAEREPMAAIERAPGQWTTDRQWPPRTTRTTTLRPGPGTAPGVGTLTTAPARPGATETFTDDPRLAETDWASAVDLSTPAKAGFTTRPLTRDLRLAGSGSVTVTATPTTTSAHLSAVLVDVGPATIRDYAAAGEGITTLPGRTCWGASTAGDSACYKETEPDTADVGFTVVARGWADLGTWADPRRGRPLTPGRPYALTVRLAAADHVVPAGHRLALIVAGTDRDLIDPPASRPSLTLDLARTAARLPLVGGEAAFARATAGALPHPVERRAAPLAGVAGPRPAPRVPAPGAAAPAPVPGGAGGTAPRPAPAAASGGLR